MKKQKTILCLRKFSIADLGKLAARGGDENYTLVMGTLCDEATYIPCNILGGTPDTYDCRKTEVTCPDEGFVQTSVKNSNKC